jgi:hypothetical protein
MLRRAMVLLVAPVLVAGAQTPKRGPVEIPVSSAPVTVSVSSEGYQLIYTKGAFKEPPIRGRGSVSYSLSPENAVSIAATDSTAVVSVELKDQGRTVAFFNGRSITLRRHDGLLAVDARQDGAAPIPPRPPGRE